MAGFSRFSPNCCCGPDCTVFTDDFNRTGSPGANWNVISGTWTCATTGGGQITTTDANAEIDQTSGAVAGQASAVVSGSGQLQVGLASGGGYVAAELDTTAGKFRIVSVSGGGRTVLRECTADVTTGTVALCSDTYPYGDLTVRLYTASLNGTPYHTWADEIGACETFGGLLATGTLSGTATFTSFALSNANCDDPSCPSCSQCCWPPGSELPEEVQVVISGLGPASSGLGIFPCTTAQCDALNGTYLLTQTTGCTASYTSCPDIPCCACYELTGLDLACDGEGAPITTIRFLVFNSEGGFCQGPGQCNLYVQLCTAGGDVVFQFDLGLGPAPASGAMACGTYSMTDGCGSATLLANNKTSESQTNGLVCQHDALNDPPVATAVVTPIG